MKTKVLWMLEQRPFWLGVVVAAVVCLLVGCAGIVVRPAPWLEGATVRVVSSSQGGSWFAVAQPIVEDALAARGAKTTAAANADFTIEVTTVELNKIVVVSLRAINRSSGKVHVGLAKVQYYRHSFYSPLWGYEDDDPLRIAAIQSAADTAVWTFHE